MNFNKSKALAGGLIASCIATGAAACEMVHTAHHEGSGGAYVMLLNDVEVGSGFARKGSVSLTRGLLSGQNTVTINYAPMNDGDAARFSIHYGCKADPQSTQPVASVDFDGEASKSLVFDQETPVPLPYPGAQVTDGAGLEEAVRALQTAVLAKDVDAVLATQKPVVARLEDQGHSSDRIKQHITMMLTKGEIASAQGLIIVPQMNGLTWRVWGRQYQPAISVHLEQGSGDVYWTGGSRWIFVDGAWAVLEP
ncbi:MAG: hypothetical protein AAGC81_13895 [Pseudomonadota bacterium]